MAPASPTPKGAWARSLDMDGTTVLCNAGTANSGLWFKIGTTGTITIDTTSITWAQIAPTDV